MATYNAHMVAARLHKLVQHISEMSYGAILAFYSSSILLFAFIYFLMGTFMGVAIVSSFGSIEPTSFWDFLYFSVITATSTGYGDLVPVGYARIFAGIESFAGLFLLAVFVSKIISHKQDIALKSIHQTSFKTAVHEMREDLYIARKDFDRAIGLLTKDNTLAESEWERVTIACDYIEHLLEEIPNFYDMENHLHVIDTKRESMLVEAVRRTLGRLSTLLALLHEKNIAVSGHSEIHTSLTRVVETGERLIPEWDRCSPHRGSADFEDVQKLIGTIRKSLI